MNICLVEYCGKKDRMNSIQFERRMGVLRTLTFKQVNK